MCGRFQANLLAAVMTAIFVSRGIQISSIKLFIHNRCLGVLSMQHVISRYLCLGVLTETEWLKLLVSPLRTYPNCRAARVTHACVPVLWRRACSVSCVLSLCSHNHFPPQKDHISGTYKICIAIKEAEMDKAETIQSRRARS